MVNWGCLIYGIWFTTLNKHVNLFIGVSFGTVLNLENLMRIFPVMFSIPQGYACLKSWFHLGMMIPIDEHHYPLVNIQKAMENHHF